MSSEEFNEVATRVIKWAESGNIREYPWRKENDPYKILVTEMLLQRTRAEQVSAVYKRFFGKYPNPETLAKANIQEIEADLITLGLKWRARNVREMARVLVERYDGRVPPDRSRLAELPGVGQYVSGAVSCFAFGRCEPFIDSNIARLVARFFGISKTGELRRNRCVAKLLTGIHSAIPTALERQFYYGLLDLSSVVCLPRKPNCVVCPLFDICAYAKRRREDKVRTR